MRHKSVFVLITIIFVFSTSCFLNQKPELNPVKIELPSDGAKVIDGINSLGLKLLKEVQNENTMISPFSASTILTLLYNGSSDNTNQQIAQLLGLTRDISPDKTYEVLMKLLPEVDKKNVEINLANALWIKDSFSVKPDYISQSKDFFHAAVFVEPFDAQTVEKINNFVKDNTNGKIDNIINNLEGEFALLNAIYFYGTWFDKFSSSNTTDAPFYLDSLHTIEVPTMHDEIYTAGRYISDTVDLCELYYGHGNYSLVIALPAEGLALDTLLQTLTINKWNYWISNIYRASDVSVSLPKFSFEKSYDLVEPLQNLGMQDAFDDNANFSNICDLPLKVTIIKQKTFIEVNEKGTEAAATTFGMMETSAMPDFFDANRPFIFAIRETTTGLILFLGIVRNPLE